MIERVVSTFGSVDLLVLAHSIQMNAKFSEIEEGALQTLLDSVHRINYESYVFCTYYALKHLKENFGQIVAVSSVSGMGVLAYQ